MGFLQLLKTAASVLGIAVTAGCSHAPLTRVAALEARVAALEASGVRRHAPAEDAGDVASSWIPATGLDENPALIYSPRLLPEPSGLTPVQLQDLLRAARAATRRYRQSDEPMPLIASPFPLPDPSQSLSDEQVAERVRQAEDALRRWRERQQR